MPYSAAESAALIGGLQQKGREWRGPCPLCGGDPDTTRFKVSPHPRDPTRAAFACFNGCLGKENDPDSANYGRLMALLDDRSGKNRASKNGSGPHICGDLCVDYDVVAGQAKLKGQDVPTIREHRGVPGNPKKLFTEPKIGFRPVTYTTLHAPPGEYDLHTWVIVEGPKTARRGILETGYAAVTWLSGTGNVRNVEFTRAMGKHAVIWPDADKPGLKCLQVAVKRLIAAEAASITVVEIGRIPGVDLENLPAARGKDAEHVDDLDLRRQLIEEALPYEDSPLVESDELADDGPVYTGEDDGNDYADLWGRTSLGDAARLLRAFDDDLLVVFDAKGHAELMMSTPAGIWRAHDARMSSAMVKTAKDWEGEAFTAATREDALQVRKWALRSASPTGQADCLKMIGGAYMELERLGQMPNGLTACNIKDLNKDRDCMGTPNGVLNVRTGLLLSPAEGRRRFITKMIPDPYDAKAKHWAVDLLSNRFQEGERDWLWQALGAALRGYCQKRLYIVKGDSDAGKTVLIDAILYTLGVSEYASKLPANAFVGGGWESKDKPEPSKFYLANGIRACIMDEPVYGRGRQMDWVTLRDVTGGKAGTARLLRENPVELVFTATMFWAMNEYPQLPYGKAEAGAVETRLRVLRMETIPKAQQDPRLEDVFELEPKARQAFFARMVRYSVADGRRPADIPTVADAKRELQQDSAGEIGEWLKTALVRPKGGALGGRAQLEANDLYEKAIDLFGTDGKLDGWTKTGLTQAAREEYDLPPTTGKPRKWLGIRLKTDEEVAADEVEAEMAGKLYCPGPNCDKPMPADRELCADCEKADGGPPADGGDSATGTLGVPYAPRFAISPPPVDPLSAAISTRLDVLAATGLVEMRDAVEAGALRGLAVALDANPAALPAHIVDKYGGADAVIDGLTRLAVKNRSQDPRGLSPAEMGEVMERVPWADGLRHLRMGNVEAELAATQQNNLFTRVAEWWSRVLQLELPL